MRKRKAKKAAKAAAAEAEAEAAALAAEPEPEPEPEPEDDDDDDGGGPEPEAEPEPEAKAGDAAASGTMKAAPGFDELDETLPPSMMTAKLLAKYVGGNKAGREACMAICSGESLTAAQKRAVFRMGKKRGVTPSVMTTIAKQSDGVGVTCVQLHFPHTDCARPSATHPPRRPLATHRPAELVEAKATAVGFVREKSTRFPCVATDAPLFKDTALPCGLP